MKKIIIWGAGTQGENILHYFDMDKVSILGYVDSDSCKVGKLIRDYEVMGINQIASISYDFIFISSIEHQDEIYDKALEMGIPRDKIIFPLMTNTQMGKVYDLLTDRKSVV